MITALRRFLRDERGATAIEYGIIAVGISVTIVVAVTAIGTNVKQRYDYVLEKVSSGN
ncbi:Flp family type IVb pilin [Xanthobacteraceae bacterium Astr-EGSB]|uniref:Flp family type IVb pilin n=1 Tax=Astrobacterium formosum TaxID=3069710 RepID=UPI0027B7E971|nr:Flp family type IVb pilin [Xanthobacteraceae bacterium Astr-EGSB]